VAPANASAVILVVVSILAIIATGIIGPPSAVMGVLALKRNAADPAGSRSQTVKGWIVFAVNAVIGGALIAALVWWRNNR